MMNKKEKSINSHGYEKYIKIKMTAQGYIGTLEDGEFEYITPEDVSLRVPPIFVVDDDGDKSAIELNGGGEHYNAVDAEQEAIDWWYERCQEDEESYGDFEVCIVKLETNEIGDPVDVERYAFIV